ncbi:MAG: DUF1153 domain-containing protein [Yoonia sp.]|nr:DUF1153 domain-containing protein [Yoonia sp.]
MFLKKIDGPRSVTLPDGSIMTRADLPPPETRRWVASRKATVVRAVLSGLISRESAQSTYALSDDEYMEWEQAIMQHGEDALKATALKHYRQS